MHSSWKEIFIRLIILQFEQNIEQKLQKLS